jgi:predicted DNA-binding transcriptional regulator AlpA
MRAPVSSKSNHPERSKKPRELVPDPVTRLEFGVSEMTIWRWERDETLQFPKPVAIRSRKFRFRDELEAFKARLVEATESGAAATVNPREVAADARRRQAEQASANGKGYVRG